MMNKPVHLFLVSLLIVFGALTTYFQTYNLDLGYQLMIYVAGFITIATGFIFFRKDTVHFKFMYPGLLTFLIFMVIPIFFSLYVSFTNLSTGHFLSENQVKSLMLEERHLVDDSKVVTFKLYKGVDNYLISTPTLDGLSLFNIDNDTEVNLVSSKDLNENDFKELSTKEIFSIREKLRNISFLTRDDIKLSYYRVSKLAQLNPTFVTNSKGELINTKTSQVFTPNSETGYFTSSDGKTKLAPGYYVNVGLKNFYSIFKNETIKSSFLKVCLWTLIWGVSSVFLSFSAGMFLAIFLNDKNLKLKPVYRSLLIIPYSIPFFISVLIFKGMLNKDFGIINEFISSMGFEKVSWLGDPIMAKVSALLVNLWLGFPYMFLLITGILQSIPASVYDAAKLDGAGVWRTFKSITLPLIMSSIAPLLIGSFAFNLNNFVGIYLLTGGGPPIPGAVTPVGETDILISYTYRLAFEGAGGQDFGLASTISLFIFLIISILTLINFRLSNMTKEEA